MVQIYRDMLLCFNIMNTGDTSTTIIIDNTNLKAAQNAIVLQQQGLKLTVASGKFATWKSRLLPIEKVSSKKLLPENSAVKVNSGK